MTDWQTKKLGDLARVGDGLHSTPQYVPSSDFYFINGNNISNGKVNIWENTKMVAKDEYLKHKNPIDESSVLLSINGTIGNVAYYENEKVILGKSAAYINCSDKILRPYLFALLTSSDTQNFFRNEQTGSTIKNLSLKTIRDVPIPLPEIQEQERIVGVLEVWDEYIEKLEEKIALKEQLKKGLMQQLLTGKRRFPGYQNEWEKQEIGELLVYQQPTPYIVRSTNYAGSGIPVLTANKSFVLGYTRELEGTYECKDKGVIIFDDFTMASKFVNFTFKVKSSAIKILRPTNPKVNIKFVFERMQLIPTIIGEHRRNYISEYQYNAIAIPSPEEQNAIAAVSDFLDDEINLLKNKLSVIIHQKKYLLKNLITGTIRTPENLKPKGAN